MKNYPHLESELRAKFRAALAAQPDESAAP
jgi:hypothetical protein